MGEIKIDENIKRMLAKQSIWCFNSFFTADFTEKELIDIIDYMFTLVENISKNPAMSVHMDNIQYFKSNFEKSVCQIVNYNPNNHLTLEHEAAQKDAANAANTLLLSLEKYIKCIYQDLKKISPPKDYRMSLRNEFKDIYLKNKMNEKNIIGPNLDRFIQLTVDNRNDLAHYNAAKMNYEGIEILMAYETLVIWLIFTKIHMELKALQNKDN